MYDKFRNVRTRYKYIFDYLFGSAFLHINTMIIRILKDYL